MITLVPTRWTRACLMAALAFATAGMGQDPAGPRAPGSKLYIFFTPDDRLNLDAEFLKALIARGVSVVPHLLLERRFQLATSPIGQDLFESLRALQRILGEGKLGLAVLDAEGLAIARRFGISATPAFVFTPFPSRAHVTYGAEVNVKELLACPN